MTPHSTLRGLWAESSPLTESVTALNQMISSDPAADPNRGAARVGYMPERALSTLPSLGVRYLIVHSEETVRAVRASVLATEVTSAGELVLFDLGEPQRVIALDCTATGPRAQGLRADALQWISQPVDERPWIVYGTIPGIGGDAASCVPVEGPSRPTVTIDRDHIVLSTDRVGAPHLVTYSYFPDWTVEGGSGPWPATPWFMVVVPDQPTTTLSFGWALEEWLGALVSLTSLLIATVRWRRRRNGAAPLLVTGRVGSATLRKDDAL
jgi:hypothetical protein